MEKLFHANRNKNRAGLTILIPQKLELERKIVKKTNTLIIKGSIQYAAITIVNIYGSQKKHIIHKVNNRYKGRY